MAKKKDTRMITQDLPVKLTPDQLNDRARELVHTLAAIEDEDDARKRENDRRNGIIKDLESQAAKLCDTVKTGHEPQPVRCVETYDYKAQKVIVTRDDTDELVSTRPMSKDELQQGMEEILAHTAPPEEPKPVIDLVAVLASTQPVETAVKQLAAPATEDLQADFNQLVDRAVQIIRETKRAALTTVQRRLRIGYTAAVAIMDELQARGIVGPPNGSAPRDIINLPEAPATT